MGPDDLARVIDRVGLLQIDAVSVFCRSHYMPLFSRLGPYSRETLDSIAGHTDGHIDRRLVEYWAHQASLIPLELRPLLRWRMARADVEAHPQFIEFARSHRALVLRVREIVRDRGPVRAADVARETGERVPRSGRSMLMLNWTEAKMALEYLFYTGEVVVERRVDFERIYDLPARVLPGEAMASTLSEDDAQRQLVRTAARALGVATERDVGDYFRLPRAASKSRVAELVATGALAPVVVEGWAAPAYLWSTAARPSTIGAVALLSPFDSLIWTRERVRRLFGFDYRIEIYTPATKRIYGYYVLPFLLGDVLVARVDLKSDRKAGVLLVQAVHGEDGIDRQAVVKELAAELRAVAEWIGLPAVRVTAADGLAQLLTLELA